MRRAIAIMCLICTACPVSAAIAPEYLLQARREADSHVQVDIIAIDLSRQSQICYLHTIVRHAWGQNGHAAPPIGSTLDLNVPCLFPGQDMPSGGTVWFYPNELHVRMTLEGFVTGHPVAAGQVFVVPYPRSQPWCDTQHDACDLPA